MAREQIIEKAKNYQGDKLSFVDGAEWMQAVMIEKACELYEEALCRARRTGIHGIPQMVNMFKQAMEG